MWWRACIFVLALLLPANAGSFTLFVDTTSIGGDPSVFYIDGRITKETWERFIARPSTVKTVELNSVGGYIIYAEAISKIIRERKLTTKVRNGGICLSACVLIFQSGVKRITHRTSLFMLHPVTITVAGITIPDKWSTNRYYGWLMRYGMKVSAVGILRRDKDVYFNAKQALEYGVATEIEGKITKK